MMPATCAHLRLDLGAYALGALDPADAAVLRAHLQQCSTCGAEYAELAQVSATLAQSGAEPSGVNDGGAAGGASTDPALAGILDRLQGERARNRRRRVLEMVAVVVLVIAIGGASWVAATTVDSSEQADQPRESGEAPTESYDSTTPTGQPIRWDGRNAAAEVGATVTLRPVAWGTQVDVAMRGVEPGQTCEVVLVDTDGDEWAAGSWEVAYDGELTWTGGAAIAPTQVTRVVVVSDDTPLITLQD